MQRAFFRTGTEENDAAKAPAPEECPYFCGEERQVRPWDKGEKGVPEAVTAASTMCLTRSASIMCVRPIWMRMIWFDF